MEFLELLIPNLELKQIFIEQIQKWFKVKVRKDTQRLDVFCEAFQQADIEAIEEQMNAYLSEVIGIHDYSIKQELKENYYHGLLAGLLVHCEEWDISSNAEAGEGYSDIQLEIQEKQTCIVIEIKCPKDGNLDVGCIEALKQIERNRYESRLVNDGMTKILKYGVAFYKKKCRVFLGEIN